MSRLCRLALCILAVTVGLPHAARAQTAPSCPIKPDPAWSQTEAWAWRQICTGQPADLTALDPSPQSLTSAAPWPADRIISAAFLQTILTDPRYKPAGAAMPIVIAGARLSGPVVIEAATPQNKLYLQNDRFDGSLEIYDSTSSQGLVLDGDQLSGPLIIRRSSFSYLTVENTAAPSVSIGNGTFANNVQFSAVQFPAGLAIAGTRIGGGFDISTFDPASPNHFGAVNILDSTIGGVASITGSIFAGAFEGALSQFNGGLSITNSSFDQLAYFRDTEFAKSMDVGNTVFAQDLRFDTTNFKSELDLQNVTINPSGKSCGPNLPCELFLVGGNFAGNVMVFDSTIHGDIDADGANFTESLLISDDRRTKPPLSVKMIDAIVGGDVIFNADTLADLDLANAHIAGTLQFNNVAGHAWSPSALLSLSGANIGVLANPTWDWPQSMNVAGMRFGLIGLHPDLNQGCINGSWSAWLRAAPYSPEPYTQIANYLTNTGDQRDADCVLETSKTIAMAKLGPVMKTVNWTYGQVAGFGYAPQRAFIYAAVFIVLGMVVLRATGEGPKNNMPIGLFFSFSQFIPLVSLDKKFDDVALTGFARWYFYIHKIVGYVLALFIAAALSGLSAKG